MFSPQHAEQARALVARYPVGRSALLPLLHLVQAADGYVSDDGIGECARLLGLTKAEVNAVATFYTMYKRAPMGRHLVSVCTNFSCKVRGAAEVYGRLTDVLGVHHEETTADGAITLEHAECLGNCEGAPVVSVDYLNYECLTPQAAEELVARLRAGEVPPPTRGLPSPGIRALSTTLAGLGPAEGDGRASTVDTASAPPPAPAPDPTPGAAPGAGAEAEAEGDRAAREFDGTGVAPREAEEQSAYSSREAPTANPDAADQSSYPAGDPRSDDLEAPNEAGTREAPLHPEREDQN